MGVFNIFKKKEKNDETLQHVSATLYLERILIQTYDRAKEGFWIGTNNFSVISVDTDNELLGLTIRHHMNLTRTGR